MTTPASEGTDSRVDERSNVFLSARLQGASGWFPVRIRNISTMGAMIDGDQLPPEQSRVNLQRGTLSAHAEVVWRSGNFCGLRFDNPVDVDAWVKRQHTAQARIDEVIRAYRDGSSMSATALEELKRPSSIEDLSNQLLNICERMASSPSLTAEIGEDLVMIEAIVLSIKKLSAAAKT